MTLNNIPDRPTINQFYIKLTVDERLEKEIAWKWYRTVERFAPSGLLTRMPKMDDDGNIKDVLMVAKIYDDRVEYEIPLIRHLIETEGDRIKTAWLKQFKSINNIEYS